MGSGVTLSNEVVRKGLTFGQRFEGGESEAVPPGKGLPGRELHVSLSHWRKRKARETGENCGREGARTCGPGRAPGLPGAAHLAHFILSNTYDTPGICTSFYG